MRSKLSFSAAVVLGIGLVIVGPAYGGEPILQCDAGNGSVAAGWTQVGPGSNIDVAGTGINVTLATGSSGAIQGREEAGTGPLAEVEGDFYFANDQMSSPGADFILTLSNLPSANYLLKSFHNRASETDTTIGNVTVTGATGVTVPDSIVQTHAIMESPAEIVFRATGEDVVITYQAPDGGCGGCQAFFNGFILESGSAIVEFDSETSAAGEIQSPAVLTVTLSEAAEQVVTADYAVTGGTATGGGVDYSLSDGSLTFSPGETVKTISIDIVDDGLDEDHETIEVTLSNVAGGESVELGQTSQHTYTILDMRPRVSFADAQGSVSERVEIMHRPVPVPVYLSVPSAGVVTVDYRVIGGTASRDTDFVLADGTLSFAAGEVEADISLQIVDDNVIEADETILLELLNPSVGVLPGETTEYALTIIDGGEMEPPNLDLNEDGAIDFGDVVVLIESWLDCSLHPPELCWQ